jgi:diguanylate cyclase (GGDEF)-like protein/putative nucleotidyltransferase with HDIG domain
MPISGSMSRRAQLAVLAARNALLAGVLVEVARTTLHLGGGTAAFIDNWLYDSVNFLAAAVCAVRGWTGGPGRRGWLWLGLGIASWGAGDTYYTHVIGNDPDPPFPSLADAGYLALLPLAYIGFILLIKSRVPKLTPGVWLDGITAGLAVGSLSTAVVLQAVLDTTSGTVATVATNLAYPIGDALLLALVVAAFSLAGWKPGRAWLLLGAGLGVFAIADSVYLYQAANGTYVAGSWIDATWPAGMALLANAAWVGDSSRHDRVVDVEGRPLLIIPASCVALAVGVLVLDHFKRLNLLTLVLAIGTLAFVVARLALTFRENRRLFELTRHEAITDSLTGLGNRRQLMNQLEEVIADASVEDPWLLVIFDLDGFKGYNDAFGHPAGDALLQHFGVRLASVPDPGGAAVRLGGDEFCLLTPLRNVALDQLLDHAVSALSDRGDGFEISTSLGAVFLPDEASDAREALGEADARLYAHKHQKQTRRDRPHEVLLQALYEREPELLGHTRGVTTLAVSVGRRLGVQGRDLEELERAAQLHDIGKIAVPDHILRKPGPLTDDEWTFIRQHTLVGQRILAASPALRRIGDIVRSTHERWDGAGYPDGIAGHLIPLAARVIAVSDAFDAMTTTRPYRTALTPEAAVTEIERCAGTQFDADVVAVLARLVRHRVAA